MKKMHGKEHGGINGPLRILFEAQSAFQYELTGIKTPGDSVEWYKYHMLAMMEELGEILRSDKRWKTHRNTAFDPANKLEEIADMFITAINISLFSGFDSNDIYVAVYNKIMENALKMRGGNTNGINNSGGFK